MVTQMYQADWDKLREIVKNESKAVLNKALSDIEGHTVYHPSKFLKAGLNEEVVKAFTERTYSGTGKEQLYVDEQPVDFIDGVWGLRLLEFVASTFNITSWKMGRGSRADHLIEQLKEYNFSEKPNDD
jgi:hypothetical protein